MSSIRLFKYQLIIIFIMRGCQTHFTDIENSVLNFNLTSGLPLIWIRNRFTVLPRHQLMFELTYLSICSTFPLGQFVDLLILWYSDSVQLWTFKHTMCCIVRRRWWVLNCVFIYKIEQMSKNRSMNIECPADICITINCSNYSYESKN